jgi:hypothetical protein
MNSRLSQKQPVWSIISHYVVWFNHGVAVIGSQSATDFWSWLGGAILGIPLALWWGSLMLPFVAAIVLLTGSSPDGRVASAGSVVQAIGVLVLVACALVVAGLVGLILLFIGGY